MSNRPLYTILELPADAAPEEIKKAYHRLALKYHPDKAGPQGAEKFQQVLAAYTLLSDPEARGVYDRYGEQGLSNMEVVPAMREVGVSVSIITFFKIGFAIGSFVSANGLILFILMSLKLDGHVDFSWHTAVIPAYILFAFFAIAISISIATRLRKYRRKYCPTPSSDTSEEHSTETFDDILKTNGRPKAMKEFKFWLSHFMSLCLLLTVVLIITAAAQRERKVSTPLSWWAAFSPVLVGNLFSFTSAFIFREILHLHGIHCVSTFGIVLLNTVSMLMIVFRLTGTILIICMLEGYLDVPAYYIAIPSEIYILLAASFFLLLTRYRIMGCDKIKREMPYMSEESQQQIQHKTTGRPAVWIETTFIVFLNFFMLCGVILSTLASRLGFAYQYAFIPFFILFGGFLLVCVVLYVCFSIAGNIDQPEEACTRNDTEEIVEEGSNQHRPPFSPTTANRMPKTSSRSNNSRESRDSNDTQGESNPNKPTSPTTPCPKNASRRSDDCHIECFDDDASDHHCPHTNYSSHDDRGGFRFDDEENV